MSEQNDIKENARIGYQTAISLMISESQLYWSKFNAFIVANSIIILAATSIIVSKDGSIGIIDNRIILILAGFMGVLLNALGLLMLIRNFHFQKYWRYSAREIEDNYLKEIVKTITRGEYFAEGKQIELQVGEQVIPLQISCWGRLDVKRFGAQLMLSLLTVGYMGLTMFGIIMFFKTKA